MRKWRLFILSKILDSHNAESPFLCVQSCPKYALCWSLFYVFATVHIANSWKLRGRYARAREGCSVLSGCTWALCLNLVSKLDFSRARYAMLSFVNVSMDSVFESYKLPADFFSFAIDYWVPYINFLSSKRNNQFLDIGLFWYFLSCVLIAQWSSATFIANCVFISN